MHCWPLCTDAATPRVHMAENGAMADATCGVMVTIVTQCGVVVAVAVVALHVVAVIMPCGVAVVVAVDALRD